MKRALLLVLVVVVIGIVIAIAKIGNAKDGFQWDADKARIEHVVYWSGLIEQYHGKVGYYPFQNLALQDKSKPILVRIATA